MHDNREIKKGDSLYYGIHKVKVLEVHYDDTVKYYTVRFIDGKEKQTIKEYLTREKDNLFEFKQKFNSITLSPEIHKSDC